MAGPGSALGSQLQQQHQQHQHQQQLQQQLQQQQQQIQNQQRQLQLQLQQQAQNQHYESSTTAINDHTASRQAYNWYGTPGPAPGAHQHQSQLGSLMPSSPPTMSDSAPRPNYSFGPRLQTRSPASSMNARANAWDRPGSTSLSTQRPALPSPIGTRPAGSADGVGDAHRPLSGAAMTGANAGVKGRRW
jgi:TolA-binding protein